MSDQPIIIEQGVQNEILKASSHLKDSQPFFKLLDEVQNYDSLAITIKRQYEQAMLLFASIKFNNPFALTSNSHRCLPAFLTIADQGNLQAGYVPFSQEIDEDEFPQEFEQQEEIQKQCEIKTEQFLKSEKEKRKTIKQNEALFRFNVLNQQTEVISAANKFHELLASLLKLIETKKQIEKTFNESQSKRTLK